MKQEENVRNTYDKTARAYGEQFFNELDGKPLDRLLLNRFAKHHKKKGLVLDIGCGSGQTTKFLYENGVEDLIGIDLSSEMVTVATELSGIDRFETGNMLNLRFKDSSVRAVLAFYSIVHLELVEVREAFAEFGRVLKTDGQVLVSFHVGDETTTLDEFLGQKAEITFRYFETEQIIECAGEVGLVMEEGLVRFPYADAEYPSQRAYLTFRKS